jgi:hypothetical protein
MSLGSAAEAPSIHDFWQGWFAWSASVGIDYFIGRTMPSLLAGMNLKGIDAG